MLLRRCATCPAGSLSPQGAGARLAGRWGNCAQTSAADVAAAATARFQPAGVVRMTPFCRTKKLFVSIKKNDGKMDESLAKVLAVASAPGVDSLHTRKSLYAVYARPISVYEA